MIKFGDCLFLMKELENNSINFIVYNNSISYFYHNSK